MIHFYICVHCFKNREIIGVFHVKNHDFTPKKPHIFTNFRGAHAPESAPAYNLQVFENKNRTKRKKNTSIDNGIGKLGQSSRDSVIDFIRYVHGHKIRKKCSEDMSADLTLGGYLIGFTEFCLKYSSILL